MAIETDAVRVTLAREVAALTEERNFLLRRVQLTQTWDDADEVGMSSNALVIYAMGGPEPTTFNYPHDRYDMARCERTRAVAPESLHRRMDYLLGKYREHLDGKARRPNPFEPGPRYRNGRKIDP